jgi:DNA-directed RNA polymerase specialized sigma24 family protein
MVHLLFFQEPPLPYEDVARKIGVAKGSIGFLRMRCLERLRKALEEKGFK